VEYSALNQFLGDRACDLIGFPLMQKGVSFNLDAVKAQIQEQMEKMKSANE
jgi:hypothetical protein